MFDRLKIRRAARVVRGELAPSEEIEADGLASFWFTDGITGIWPDAYVAVTQNRLLWVLVQRPDTGAPSMGFDRLVAFRDDGYRIVLTEADPEYAASLNDPDNPRGETDALFDFTGRGSEDLLELIRQRAAPVAVVQPWKLLGLRHPTSPLNAPQYAPWVGMIREMLESGETLVEVGLANEVDMLAVAPGSGSGEGFFGVTNMRSLFRYEGAPSEVGSPSLLEIRHASVETCEVGRAWAAPTGELYQESDAPSSSAMHEIQAQGFPEMGVVWITFRDGGRVRRSSFVTGPSGGANWCALIERFRGDPTLPEGWEPTQL